MRSGSGAISGAGADMEGNRNNRYIISRQLEKTEMITVWNEDVWKKKLPTEKKRKVIRKMWSVERWLK